jgi:hypothetical protein
MSDEFKNAFYNLNFSSFLLPLSSFLFPLSSFFSALTFFLHYPRHSIHHPFVVPPLVRRQRRVVRQSHQRHFARARYHGSDASRCNAGQQTGPNVGRSVLMVKRRMRGRGRRRGRRRRRRGREGAEEYKEEREEIISESKFGIRCTQPLD